MSLTIRLDTTDLEAVADKLALLDGQTLRELRESTMDVVALSVRNAAVAETVRQLNVTADYVNQRIERKRGRREALLTRDVLVSAIRGTTLQRFGAGVRQDAKPVNWSNSRIEQMGRKFGPWPCWTRRRGDASRGIPENMKAAGVSVDVNRKGMKNIASAFTMPLRNGNGIGVFRREGQKLKHLYGPSVYQVFRRYAQEKEADILAELQDTFLIKLDGQIKRL